MPMLGCTGAKNWSEAPEVELTKGFATLRLEGASTCAKEGATTPAANAWTSPVLLGTDPDACDPVMLDCLNSWKHCLAVGRDDGSH